MFLTKIKIILKLPTKQWEVRKFFSFHGTLFIGFQFKYSIYNLSFKMKRFACFFFFLKRERLICSSKHKKHYHLEIRMILTGDTLINSFFSF